MNLRLNPDFKKNGSRERDNQTVMFCSLISSYFSLHVFLVGVPQRRVHRQHWDPSEALAHITIAVGFTETLHSSAAKTSTPYTTLPRLSSSTNKSGSLPSGLVFSRQQTCSLKQWRNCSILKKKNLFSAFFQTFKCIQLTCRLISHPARCQHHLKPLR